jgi:hypothetical protein
MSINAIGGATISNAFSTTQSKADETTQELAQQGDPVAIAKLKQEQQLEDPALATPASEPGKGEQLDQYL